MELELKILKEKARDVNLGTADYQGSPTGKKSRRTRQVGGDNDNNNQNSVVQPKVILKWMHQHLILLLLDQLKLKWCST